MKSTSSRGLGRTANPEPPADRDGILATLRRAGAKALAVLHFGNAKPPKQAESIARILAAKMEQAGLPEPYRAALRDRMQVGAFASEFEVGPAVEAAATIRDRAAAAASSLGREVAEEAATAAIRAGLSPAEVGRQLCSLVAARDELTAFRQVTGEDGKTTLVSTGTAAEMVTTHPPPGGRPADPTGIYERRRQQAQQAKL